MQITVGSVYVLVEKAVIHLMTRDLRTKSKTLTADVLAVATSKAHK